MASLVRYRRQPEGGPAEMRLTVQISHAHGVFPPHAGGDRLDQGASIFQRARTRQPELNLTHPNEEVSRHLPPTLALVRAHPPPQVGRGFTLPLKPSSSARNAIQFASHVGGRTGPGGPHGLQNRSRGTVGCRGWV